MKNVLITGSSGLLGSELVQKFKPLYNLMYTARTSLINNSKILDIRQRDRVVKLVKSFNPSIIINCAAYTDVDAAEKERKLARDINVLGLSNLIKASSKSTKIIHISSDYVFDGKKGDYIEEDTTFPINYYGKTKLESENILIGSNLRYLIIRPNVLYSDNLSKNHFLSWVVKSLSKNKEIKITKDQINNPTYVPDLVEVISDTILLDYCGIIHIGSEDHLSRYDFANKVADVFSLNKKLIIPIDSKSLNQIARRPLNSSLNCNKIKKELNIELYPVEYGIRRVNLNI